jgi:hypothetical protein
MPSPAQALGARAEQLALEHLQGRGLTVLEHNFGQRLGEIALVALDHAMLVIAELRIRSSHKFGAATARVRGYLTTFSCGRGRLSSAAGGFGGGGGPRSCSENTIPSPVSRA